MNTGENKRNKSVEELLQADPLMRRFLEINWDVLELMAKTGYGEIHQVSIKEGKIMVSRQKLILEGQNF